MTARLLLMSAGAILLAAVPATGQSRTGALRLTPEAIAALPLLQAGTGTSGVGGIRTTLLAGNPAAKGLYTIALNVPANTRIAAHRHRDARSAVVVAGTWWFGYGKSASEARLRPLAPGSFYTEPASVPHFARTGDQAVLVYITGVGPSDTTYVPRDAGHSPR